MLLYQTSKEQTNSREQICCVPTRIVFTLFQARFTTKMLQTSVSWKISLSSTISWIPEATRQLEHYRKLGYFRKVKWSLCRKHIFSNQLFENFKTCGSLLLLDCCINLVCGYFVVAVEVAVTQTLLTEPNMRYTTLVSLERCRVQYPDTNVTTHSKPRVSRGNCACKRQRLN